MEIYDMHCHLNEFQENELEEIFKSNIKVVAVSEDIKSLNKIIELSYSYPKNVIPCGGFHPWMIKEGKTEEVKIILKIIEKNGLKCIGEVGIDKRFLSEDTYKMQEEIFLLFVNLAKELNAMINIHSPNAWNEVLNILKNKEVKKAMFHWYTGPLTLIDQIIREDYVISLNAALMIQKKYQKIIENTPLSSVVLESDGPYNYHGVRLSPLMLYKFIDFISGIKKVERNTIISTTSKNAMKLLSLSF
ncbi:MAG: TatD family deoxyribonuclease [Caldisphaera sp.]|jgi:TatD DNase family protein|uniref:TatD family hydrolase n=1 Tax=Caldisphaera sp. TaxID=2060322 RepID=UPI000CA848A0|nr:MAG: TatD family deoxyribonuclease [Caldisphaera sp.]PMP89361.1 MAG: TatD family deoxyribonuclease [Caldisphaera sp.]